MSEEGNADLDRVSRAIEDFARLHRGDDLAAIARFLEQRSAFFRGELTRVENAQRALEQLRSGVVAPDEELVNLAALLRSV